MGAPHRIHGLEVLEFAQVPQLDAVVGCGRQVVAIFREGHGVHRPLVACQVGHALRQRTAGSDPAQS